MLQRHTPLGQAFVNKVNFCRRYPDHYEEWQIKLHGRILDNSKPEKKPTRHSRTAPATPPCAPAALSSVDHLAETLVAMDLNNKHFGTVSHGEAITANLTQGYRNKGLKIFSTDNVIVGSTPVISTTTMTIMLSNIDARWFGRDVENFLPFKMTQTSHNSLVFEYPIADYDFFFSPRMNEENSFDKEDIADALIVSTEDAEQYEYEIMRNQIIDEENRNEAWHGRLQINFECERLDYSIIHPNQRNGVIPMEFVFAPVPAVKWRIAVVPDNQRVLRPKEKETNSAHDLYQEYLAIRQSALDKAKEEGSQMY